MNTAGHAQVVCAGVVSGTAQTACSIGIAGQAIIDCAVTIACIGCIIIGVEGINAGNAARVIIATDAIANTEDTCSSKWAHGIQVASGDVASLAEIVGRANEAVRISTGIAVTLEEG